MTSSDRLLTLGTAFKTMRIRHPRLVQAHARLDELRALGRASVGEPQEIVPIIGPSGSGKTTIFRAWMEDVAKAKRAGLDAPPTVLHVTLSARSSVKQLGADILYALGRYGLPGEIVDDMIGRQRGARPARALDPFKNLKDAQVMHAAATALANAGVELLGIDELHHLVDKDHKGKVAWSVSEALKVLADTGVCPVAVIGTSMAMRIVSSTNNPQFAGRCADPLMLDPLDITLSDERKLFLGYVASLSKQLVETGVFKVDQNLMREDFLACFYDLSGGVIGNVSRLVKKAAANALRRGSERIEREDLSLATRAWAMRLDITNHDPWTQGARDFKLVRRAA